MAGVLAVTKDYWATNCIIKIARELDKNGHQISVATEGPSLELWPKADFPLNIVSNQSEFDAEALLSKTSPAVIIAGLSSPINLEEVIGVAANDLKIPLVWIEDTWGAHTRSKAKPNFVITIDNLGEKLVKEAGEKNDWGLEDDDIFVAGNPAYDAYLKINISIADKSEMDELKKKGPVALLAGQGSYTTDIIQILALSIAETQKHVTVVPKLHPKHKDEKDRKFWQSQLKLLEALRHGSVKELPAISGEVAACLADFTVSTFSTLLFMSALSHKIPVSIATEETVAGMRKSTGLGRYPLVEVEAAVEINRPVNFNAFEGDYSRSIKERQNRFLNQVKPFSASSSAEEIEKKFLN